MNRLGLIIILVCIGVLSVKFYFMQNKTLSSLVNAQCVCDVDPYWAPEYQKKLIDIIKEFYDASNNPEEVIKKTVEKFKEIETMNAEICGVDSICFHAHGLKPIFLLADRLIVVEDGSAFDKQNFDQSVIDGLPKINSKIFDQTMIMVQFIESIPLVIGKEYEIDWQDRNYIVLQSKKHEGMRCLVSDTLIPTEKILKECSLLYDQALEKLPKKKQKKYMVEYDIRFKKQIIVRSGGNYG